MSKELKEVRILMLGESGVGKTSLILSLISEQFYDETADPSYEIPAKLEPITIPAEVTQENIPGVIVDYSSREQNEQELVREIEKADVICLVYAMNDSSSKEKLSSYYLPKIREVEDSAQSAASSGITSSLSPSNSFSASTPQPSSTTSFANFEASMNLTNSERPVNKSVNTPAFRRPIVIVANKSDLNSDRTSPVRDTLITQLITSNSQIETCIECSAKTLKNVPEVFYYAQKSVLFPTSPIYDAEKKQLTQQVVKCLTRIFRICDADNDGVLNDKELADFQLKCFNLRLNGSTLQEVKSILRSNDDNRNYLVNNGITLNGFFHLHELFINKGRHETSWTVLKKFGYDRNLTFNREYAHPSLKVPTNCSVELSLKGFEFLQHLFNKYDLDRDDCLNRKELEDLFSICPIRMPWGNDVHNTVCAIPDENSTAVTSKLTYIGFLSQWVLTTYFDHKTTLELFSYLGYNHLNDESQLNALTVSRPKEIDVVKKQTHRNAFLCYVFGRKKCGKTAFLQGLLGRDLQDQAKLLPDEMTRWSCNLVQFQNIEKYLILKEINSGDIEFHEVYPPDVVILMYDLTDPNSFSFIADIFLSIYKDRPIPCMLVGTKSDQTEIPQNYPINAEKFAELYKLPPPQYFSAATTFLNKSDIYAKILAVANYPKMYPMGSQIWRFFEKIGAAASINSNKPSPYRSLNRVAQGEPARDETVGQIIANKLSYWNPLSLFFNSSRDLRPRSAKDPDSMMMRYSILAAGCLCVSLIIVKLMRN